MNKPTYEWIEEVGIAYCTVPYKDIEFFGCAHCHPDDMDVCSKLTGQTIAEARAVQELLRHIRDNELRPQLKILKQLYYSMNRSKHYNRKSYEAKMLYRQINRLETAIQDIQAEIKSIGVEIKRYIDDKEHDFQLIRNKRAAKDNQ